MIKIIKEDTKPIKLKGNHYYRFIDHSDNDTTEYIGKYVGRQPGFECMVCGKGHSAHCFNIYHSDDDMDYETWAYGTEHLPEIIEDITESDK